MVLGSNVIISLQLLKLEHGGNIFRACIYENKKKILSILLLSTKQRIEMALLNEIAFLSVMIKFWAERFQFFLDYWKNIVFY